METIQQYLKNISEINNLNIAESGNKAGKWIFYHGMLFSSPYKWWQVRDSLGLAKRKTLHEGLDILFYKDKNQRIQKLNTGALISTATNGTIINICDDFLGQSIIVRHSISFQQELDLIFIYAHILPDIKIKIGSDLKQGDIIASISDTVEKKINIPPHLHLSVIEIPKNTPENSLNWDFFSDTKNKLNLINPLFL